MSSTFSWAWVATEKDLRESNCPVKPVAELLKHFFWLLRDLNDSDRSLTDNEEGLSPIQLELKHWSIVQRSFGSTAKRPLISSFASSDTCFQSSVMNDQSPVRIFRNKALWSSSKKGGYPTSKTKITIPTLQRSTRWSWGRFFKILQWNGSVFVLLNLQRTYSGATYVGVPTRLVKDSGIWTRFAKPKSPTRILALSDSLAKNRF